MAPTVLKGSGGSRGARGAGVERRLQPSGLGLEQRLAQPIIGESSNIVSTLTSAGYEVDFQFDGTFGNAQIIFYTVALCGSGGSMYLNDGNAASGDFMNPNQLFWTQQGFAKVSSTSSQAISGTVSNYDPINTPACSTGGGTFGWPLTLVSNTAAGLPSSIPTGTIVISATQP